MKIVQHHQAARLGFKTGDTIYMATVTAPLSLAEFHARFDGEKPYFEYWFGEAVQKAMPTWLHSVLQGLLIAFLHQAGYKAGSETRLKIMPGWEPVPDVIGSSRSIEGRYPTAPVDLAIEILSPDDSFSMVSRKCKLYADSGIGAIFVLDPDQKLAWSWDSKLQGLASVENLTLPNGNTIELPHVWQEMDARR